VSVLEAVEPQDSSGAHAHGEYRLAVHLRGEALDPRASLRIELRARSPKSVAWSLVNRHLDDRLARRTQQLRQPPGEPPGIGLESQLYLPLALSPVHVLAQTAEVVDSPPICVRRTSSSPVSTAWCATAIACRMLDFPALFAPQTRVMGRSGTHWDAARR
jgi:hypothetical protein